MIGEALEPARLLAAQIRLDSVGGQLRVCGGRACAGCDAAICRADAVRQAAAQSKPDEAAYRTADSRTDRAAARTANSAPQPAALPAEIGAEDGAGQQAARLEIGSGAGAGCGQFVVRNAASGETFADVIQLGACGIRHGIARLVVAS